ncbi:MAG: hypothetical protein WA964_15920, partial [Ilumatobacter sp.]|uniref:hypothetical protein n=1 Tax=Ilumatobacter sp. TaxID=1967498 RepID=UPI003C725D2C
DIEVWVDGDHRSRVDEAGSIRIRNGDEFVTYIPGHGAMASVQDCEDRSLSLPELWWRPRPLIGAIEIMSVDEGSMLGRPSWQVEAKRDLARDPMLQMLLPGDRFSLTVDQETGVVLRCEEWSGDAELSSTEWLVFEPLERIDDLVFDQALPAGVTAKSQADAALDHALAIGVDVGDLDTADVDQIWQAIRNRMRPGLLEHHIATGEPPLDVGGAETDIRAAFAGLTEEDDGSLPNVEAGHELASTVRRAADRFAGGGAAIEVRDIKFLTGERAAVVFAILTDGKQVLLGNTVGEAVLTDGRWRVARSTFAQLMRMAGVETPPPD